VSPSQHVADLLVRVERLADTDLATEAAAGRAAAAAAAAGVLAGTLSRADFVAAVMVAAARPVVHAEAAFIGGFAEGLHAALLRISR
jgi:hypothetical protein